MSIKIYNGYRQPKMGMKDLLDYLCKFREEALEKVNIFYDKRVVAEAVLLYDNFHYRGTYYDGPSDISPFFDALDQVQENSKKIKSQGIRNPSYDFQLEILFIPFEDHIYSLVYSENFTHLWENQEQVSPFPYWNNTDEPSGLSREEWKKREEIWGQVFRDWKSPAAVGFNYLISEVDYYRVPQFAMGLKGKDPIPQELIPSFDKRVFRLAQEMAWSKHVESTEMDKKIINRRDLTSKYVDWKLNQSEEAREPFVKKLESTMKTDFLKEDLFQNPTEPHIGHDYDYEDLFSK